MYSRFVIVLFVVVSVCCSTFGLSAKAELPICKSAVGRIGGGWEYVVGVSYGEPSILMQMFRKKEYDLRLEFINTNKGYFSIQGKTRGDIAGFKIFVDGKLINQFRHNPKSSKKANPTLRDKQFYKVLLAFINGTSGRMEIVNSSGDVRKFDMQLSKFNEGYRIAAPNFDRIAQLHYDKKCRGAF